MRNKAHKLATILRNLEDREEHKEYNCDTSLGTNYSTSITYDRDTSKDEEDHIVESILRVHESPWSLEVLKNLKEAAHADDEC